MYKTSNRRTARLTSPMQVQGTELLPVITHFEWSLAEWNQQFSIPFIPSMVNDLTFIALQKRQTFQMRVSNRDPWSTYLYRPEQDELNLSREFNQVSAYTFDWVIFAIKSSYKSTNAKQKFKSKI